MKLRNKKTGEILESARSSTVIKDKFKIYDELSDKYYTYNSLAELNAEWEGCEEPKEYWYIMGKGEIRCIEDEDTDFDNKHKEIGNYFDTREEAEKAVEKLKAFKRLKDKGFRFRWVDKDSGNIKYAFYIDLSMNPGEINRFDYEDLDLLFGGEE